MKLVSVPFSRAGYQPKHPFVLAANPKAQVPVLEDGELVLYDSTIILEHLEDRYPEPALYPRDPLARATITFAASLGAGLGDAHPRLRSWYKRVLARPSVGAEVAGLTAAMAALS